MAESNWKDFKFNQFIKLNRGFDLPNDKIIDGEYPVVASTSIKAFHKVAKVKGPGVVTGRSGSLGAVQYIEGDFWPLNTALYVKDFKGNHPQFVYYFLRCMRLENFNSGAGVPTLNQNHLHKLAISIPTLDLQKKIASILSAYDDLIENNKRRIAILEKMAEEIYREWFVRMRFPSYATDFTKATSDNKSTGEQPTFNQGGLPLGWQRLPSDLVFHVLGGGTPKTEVSTYWNGDIPFFTPKDAPDQIYVNDTEKTITEDGLRSCSSDLFPRHTLFITARGTVGKLALAQRPMAMNQSCYALLQKSQCQRVYFYYLAMKDALAYVKGISKSGVFDNIIIDTFKNVPIVLPSDQVITAFNRIAEPIFGLVENLIDSNRNLIKTRDLLLPSLISGKLSVENIELPSNENLAPISAQPPQQEIAYA